MIVNTYEEGELLFGNVKKVAEITGLSKSTLDKLRLYQPEKSPPFLRIGHSVIYPLSGPNGLGKWLEQRVFGASTAAGAR